MESEVTLTNIKERLNSLGMDYESLDNAEQRNLIKIETEISKRFSGQRASLDSLKLNKINVNTIAKSGSISNKTVYKYNILFLYIKACEEAYNAALPCNKDVEKELRCRLDEANEIIRKLDLHTVDVELLSAEIDKLKTDASDDATKIANLTEENLKFTFELMALRKAHPELFEEPKAQIISLNGVTQK